MGNSQIKGDRISRQDRRPSTGSTASTGSIYSEYDWRESVTPILVKLSEETYFTIQEVVALKDVFENMSCRKSSQGRIFKDEFYEAIINSGNSNLFLDRVFCLFDKKRNGFVDFEDFVLALSVFHPRASLIEKTRFSFDIFDIDQTGEIKAEHIRLFMTSLFEDSGSIFVLSDFVIDEIVNNTMKEIGVQDNCSITLKEWYRQIQKRPNFIAYMTVHELAKLTRKSCDNFST